MSTVTIVIVTLLFSAFFSGIEIAFISSNRLKLELDKNSDSLISKINPEEYKELLGQGIIAKGMIPKMDNCYNAISRGVNNVMIGHALDLENLFSEGRSTGTLLVG